jgi:hypothetical protein
MVSGGAVNSSEVAIAASGAGGLSWAGDVVHWGVFGLVDFDSFEIAGVSALLLRGSAFYFLGVRF